MLGGVPEGLTARQLDVLDHRFYDDPRDDYRWLRDEAPVYRDEHNALWVVSRYDDVLRVERERRWFSSARGSRPHLGYARSMINTDDPEHAAIRRIVQRVFTPEGVSNLATAVAAHVDAILDEVCEAGSCDFAEDVAARIPVAVIAELLGFSPEEHDLLRHCSDVTNASAAHPRYQTPEVPLVIGAFQRALEPVIETRREQPRDDLVSLLAHASVGGERLTSEDILHEALLLLDGGADTTRFVLASAMRALIEHPDQRSYLLDHPPALAEAVPEFVRWATPVLNMGRSVKQPVELHGQGLEPGDWVLLLYPAANRDDRVFKEPERFDVRRAPKHLAFGFGTHHCLGANLANLEVHIAMERVLRRLPEAEIAGPVTETPTAFVRGLATLPIEFSPTASLREAGGREAASGWRTGA